MPPTLEVILILIREFWARSRISVMRPAGLGVPPITLYGMVPKEVATPLPRFVVRKTLVKSMKPPGVNSASPILKARGEAWGLFDSAWGRGSEEEIAGGTNAAA